MIIDIFQKKWKNNKKCKAVINENIKEKQGKLLDIMLKS